MNGLIWAIWHLTLFFSEDMYQASLGIGATAFYIYMIDTILLSFIITWLFVRSNNSTFTIIVFHLWINVSPIDDLFTVSTLAKGVRLLLLIGLTVLIVREFLRSYPF